MRLFFKGAPGETVSEKLAITNAGAAPYEFLIHLQDWNRDSLGNKRYFPMSTQPHSNAAYISVPQTTLRIGPNETRTFTVTMKIPPAGTESTTTNSMLFFTQSQAQALDPKSKAAIGIKIKIEFGIQLFYTPADAKEGTSNFIGFDYEPIQVKDSVDHQLRLTFENTGEINKDGVVRFELTNKKTGEETKLNPVPLAIQPLSKQILKYPLKKLARGDYLAVAILDFPADNEIKVAEKNIHVEE